MKRKIAMWMAWACIVLLAACKKEKNPADPGINNGSYTQLKVGNYWVYEKYTIDDTAGTVVPTGLYDTVYIEKDTIINGLRYYKQIENNFPFSAHHAVYLRDSLHYLIDHHGQVLFSSQDFNSIFGYTVIASSSDTLHTITTKMTDRDMVVTVPAGTFTTVNYQWEIRNYPGTDVFGEYRNRNHRYARGIGQVSRDLPYFSGSPTRTSLVLVSYHLN